MNPYLPPIERVMAKVIPEPNSGCWLWLGATRSKDERPVMMVNGKNITVYRFMYEHSVGPIPEGMLVCHTCDIAFCVNPDHLFIGTYRDNTLDSVKKGRHWTQKYPELVKSCGFTRTGMEAWAKGKRLRRVIPNDQKPIIYKRFLNGETGSSLGREYGVTRNAIYGLVKREKQRELLAKVKED